VNDRTRGNLFSAAMTAALALVLVGIVGAVLVGTSAPDPPDAIAVRSLPALFSANVPTERVSAPVIVQNIADMSQQHHSMMDQMRASVSPAMDLLMNRDPMWQMMRSSAYIADFERHEQDIDRMLARGG